MNLIVSPCLDLQELGGILDRGHNLPFPDGLLINGRGWNGYMFQVDQGLSSEFPIDVEIRGVI